jgi:hypothetical protein
MMGVAPDKEKRVRTGLRFSIANLPKNSSILSATLQVQTKGYYALGPSTLNAVVYGEDVDSSASFLTGDALMNRDTTMTSADFTFEGRDWINDGCVEDSNPAAAIITNPEMIAGRRLLQDLDAKPCLDEILKLSDVSAVLREIYNRPGFAAGRQSVTLLLISPLRGGNTASFHMEAYESDSKRAAKLFVDYQPPASACAPLPPNSPPAVPTPPPPPQPPVNEPCYEELTYDEGTFNDGSKRDSLYRAKQDCLWYIRPKNGGPIKLTFDYFSVENGFDQVRVYDGKDTTGEIIAKLSGYEVPEPVTTKSGALVVRFSTDYKSAGKGFGARWIFGAGANKSPPPPHPSPPPPNMEHILAGSSIARVL